jgi:hypothetical protein
MTYKEIKHKIDLVKYALSIETNEQARVCLALVGMDYIKMTFELRKLFPVENPLPTTIEPRKKESRYKKIWKDKQDLKRLRQGRFARI